MTIFQTSPDNAYDDERAVAPDHHGAFSPEDLTRLRDMYAASAAACRVSSENENAEALGRAVIRLFRNGVRQPSVAAAMLSTAFRRT